MWDKISNAFNSSPNIIWNISLIVTAVLFGLLIRYVLILIVRISFGKATGFSFSNSIIKHFKTPAVFFLPLLALNFMLPLMRMKDSFYQTFHKIIGICLTIAFAAILIAVIKVIEDFIMNTYDLKKTDNLRERKIRTQLQFIRKLSVAIIIILAACAILLSFDNLRKLGAGLLTGVGVGGIIIGFAAQRSLANLLAGLQIAFTQPIRIDDVLVVEGEWGRVDEITLTYVVVRIWDQRRLILPINYFIEKPFQNWTRTSAEILGTAFLYLDYTVPVEALRKECMRLLEDHPLWDKRVGVVQVTNTTERAMEVRVLISAATSGNAFDLRCFMRENLVAFIQQNYPGSLPQTRIRLSGKEEALSQSNLNNVFAVE